VHGELRGLNILGYVAVNGDKVLDQADNKSDLIKLDMPLVQYAEQNDVDEIVLAVDDRRQGGLPTTDLLDCKMSGIDILDMVSFFERWTGKIRLDILYPSWLYLSEGFHESTFRNVIKRTSDILAVLLLLPVTIPLMILSITAIFIESKGRGSVFYKQTRIKQNNIPFQIYKFRSMEVDAEKAGTARRASKNDSRVTRVGSIMRALRLDELPQLINVLKGDMSFVGPRPERPEFVDELSEKLPYYAERHRVKPGLTGWAQIRYPYGCTDEDAKEKLQYDLYYVKNFSIYLDILILLQTAEVVMMGKGAQ
jgi:sugar transferase (PEP-CTERM system associated)